MPHFPDRQSHRLRGFDYGSSRVYFVTICTFDRFHFFGHIDKGTMYLNEAGNVSRSVWISLPDRFPGVQLGDFVFMPNHFHGLVTLYKRTNITNQPRRFQAQKQARQEERYPQLKKSSHFSTLGELIRTFKAASARLIRVSGTQSFAWQTQYWEEVIYDDHRFSVLCNYIHNNPTSWEKDKLYRPET